MIFSSSACLDVNIILHKIVLLIIKPRHLFYEIKVN